MDDLKNSHSHLKKEVIVKSSRELINKWVYIHFTDYIEQLDQQLFNLADKSDNNANQTRYFQTRDEIKQQHSNIQPTFLTHIDSAFNNYLNHKPTVADIDSSTHQAPPPTLSLVDNNDLEESLAISSMCRKINMQCAEYLHSLNQRLSVLRGGSKLSNHENPVAPGVFAEAIKTAVADLMLDSICKLVIYKVFESTFMGQLSKLYELINKHFEHQGLLPHIDQSIKRVHHIHPADVDDETLPQPNQASIDHQIQLFEAIKKLQTQQATTPRLDQHTLPIAQVISSIAKLQHDTAALLSSLESPQSVLNNDISELRKHSEQEALQAEDVDTHVVEIVGLLFEYMLNDRQLPDSVKTLLSYLHTPFLKIALLDKNFFNHPEHPARQLLNSLVAAGERWVEPIGKHKSDVFLQIKSVVQRLLNEFDNNVRLFSELAFEFNHYLRQHARRIRLAEKRAMQAAKGESKLKEIRLKVDSYLKKKASNISLPPTIETLLFEPWANFLSFNLLRFGSNSEQWQTAAQAVDDILWFSQSHNQNDLATQSRLKTLTTTLPATIQTGFNTVGYDSAQGNHLLQALKQQSLSTHNPIKTPAQAPIEADIDTVDITHHTETLVQKDKLLMRLQSLEFGTWFVFNMGTPDAQRVKLAWSNTNTLQFMFVNRMGQQIAVKTGEQLAKEIRNHQTKILDRLEDTPFFEKAMERVLEQLKQRESSNKPT